MAGVIESIKRLYKNCDYKTHIILFIICFVYMLLTTLTDISLHRDTSMRQNPFDFIFGLFMALYSIQYISNVLKQPEIEGLPKITEIDWRKILPLIGINIIWGIYLAIIIVALVIIWLKIKASTIFVIAAAIALIALAPLFQFIYIGLADNFKFKQLMNITLIFRFTKAAFGSFWLTTLKAILLCIPLIVGYMLIYLACGYLGLTGILEIAKDYSLIDIVMYPVFIYFFSIIWYFAFPAALADTYKVKIRPLLINENINIIEEQSSSGEQE